MRYLKTFENNDDSTDLSKQKLIYNNILSLSNIIKNQISKVMNKHSVKYDFDAIYFTDVQYQDFDFYFEEDPKEISINIETMKENDIDSMDDLMIVIRPVILNKEYDTKHDIDGSDVTVLEYIKKRRIFLNNLYNIIEDISLCNLQVVFYDEDYINKYLQGDSLNGGLFEIRKKLSDIIEENASILKKINK